MEGSAAGTIIQQLNPNDVLCGRGSGPNDYSGNIKFRGLVMDRRDEYLSTSNRASKAKVAREIVDYVKCMNPPGRFLEQVENNKNTALWRVVSEDKALEKAKQALRQNRHRRGGAGSMGSASFAMISPSASMGSNSNISNSNCEQKSSNGHYRSYSYTAGNRQHARSQSYIMNNHSMPMMQQQQPHYNYPSPPPISRAMSAEVTHNTHNSHNRSRSDHFSYAPHPDPRHHRSYSERHYDYYRPPPPPLDYYQYPEEHQHQHQQRQYTQSQIDRKYFNDYDDQALKSDEDSIINEQYDIMPDPVPSVNKRSRNFDTISPTNIDVFDQNDFSNPPRHRMESNEYFKPKRNRMFSADSDISAIELELDSATNTTKVILPPASPTDSMSIFSNNDNNDVVVKELVKQEDPLCISDIPENNTTTTGHHKRSFDVHPNDMLKDFDMSYYVLQTLGDDIHDL